MALLQTFTRELKRFFPLAVVAGLILIPEASSFVVLYAIGMTLVIAAVSHIIRKILFPYIDLSVFATKSLESPISAAIVFASVALLLAVIILATCMLLG